MVLYPIAYATTISSAAPSERLPVTPPEHPQTCVARFGIRDPDQWVALFVGYKRRVSRLSESFKCSSLTQGTSVQVEVRKATFGLRLKRTNGLSRHPPSLLCVFPCTGSLPDTCSDRSLRETSSEGGLSTTVQGGGESEGTYTSLTGRLPERDCGLFLRNDLGRCPCRLAVVSWAHLSKAFLYVNQPQVAAESLDGHTGAFLASLRIFVGDGVQCRSQILTSLRLLS